MNSGNRFHGGARSAPRADAGFSIVTTAVSVAIVAIGILATIGSMTSSAQSTRTTSEFEIARRAVARRVELLKAAKFEDVVRCFDDDPGNDPLPAGSAPGKYFAVPDLAPPAGVDPAQMGWVELPLMDVAGAMQVREDLDLPQFGMPRDLSADGVVDANDHTDTYKLLPVGVHVVWKGVDGNSSLRTTLLLAVR